MAMLWRCRGCGFAEAECAWMSEPDDPGHGGSLVERLSRLPLFRGVPRPVLEHLVAHSSTVYRKRNAPLFAAGSPANSFYVVLEGQVKVSTLMSDGRESIVEFFEPDSSFGEAAMLSLETFPVHAEALTDAALLRIPREVFVRMLQEQPVLAYRTIAALSRCSLHLSSQLRQLREMTPCQRVVDFLLSLSDTQEGSTEIKLPFSRETLATRVGIRRESLSRLLSRLRAAGVEVDGMSVKIADIARLRQAVAEAPGGF